MLTLEKIQNSVYHADLIKEFIAIDEIPNASIT